MPSIVPPSLPDAATATPTVSALIETLQAAPEVRSPWLTAAIPVYNPYCSCRLTAAHVQAKRIRIVAAEVLLLLNASLPADQQQELQVCPSQRPTVCTSPSKPNHRARRGPRGPDPAGAVGAAYDLDDLRRHRRGLEQDEAADGQDGLGLRDQLAPDLAVQLPDPAGAATLQISRRYHVHPQVNVLTKHI